MGAVLQSEILALLYGRRLIQTKRYSRFIITGEKYGFMWSVCVYLQVCEGNRRVCAVRLDVLHGVPLIYAQLVGGDLALVVADPGQEQAAWVVVMAACHLAGFVE